MKKKSRLSFEVDASYQEIFENFLLHFGREFSKRTWTFRKHSCFSDHSRHQTMAQLASCVIRAAHYVIVQVL